MLGGEGFLPEQIALAEQHFEQTLVRGYIDVILRAAS